MIKVSRLFRSNFYDTKSELEAEILVKLPDTLPSKSMNKYKALIIPAIAIVLMVVLYLINKEEKQVGLPKRLTILNDEDEELETENSRKRAEYEWTLSRDPKTGLIPDGIRSQELAVMRNMPIRENGIFNSPMVNNTYTAAGPSQNGGRTRTLVFDKRYNGTTNRVVIAGGITGGIFRSTDGGINWTFVHPANQVRSLSTLAQDTRAGFENTWYAGTGEPLGSSASYPSSFMYGEGLFKSTDNGATWSKLTSTNPTDITTFSSQWSFVHKLAVHPITGDVYAAAHRRVYRSADGGNTWTEVFGSVTNPVTTATSTGGIADLAINRTGSRIFVAMSGRNADRNLAGVFSSPNGNAGSFTRIAGGIKDAADSIPGWKGFDNTTSGGEFTGGWGRMVIALAPSNQNILYVMVENADDAAAGRPEADLFKCNMATTPFTWTKSDTLVAQRKSGSTTTNRYMELQGGYNMLLGVHPNNSDLVLAGGVNLFRSLDGFATKDNSSFIGGISSATYIDPDVASHADMHSFAFDPTNPNKVLIASDGGIGQIKDVTIPSVEWSLGNSQYQTLQYYHVGIDPTTGSRNYYGGAQDNSTTFRDRTGILGTPVSDSNDHYIVLGGDGCQVGMTKKNAAGNQFLFCAAQSGQMYRMKLFDFSNGLYTNIRPSGSADGEFITYFHLDPDNTDFLYYVSNNSIYRTGDAEKVSTSSWTLMDGVNTSVTGSIFALATTRGPYAANNHLFIGTSSGKIYRLKDPQWGASGNQPFDITPSGMTSGAVVTDISVNPRNQDTVMAVVSNYGVNSIFWTGNATAALPTWQVAEGNLAIPSVRACEIIAKTTGIEYYVGTSIGLYSTTTINGASTVWARETGAAGTPAAMMNEAIINSIAHRWTDNTMVVGTHGNGMFAASLGSPITITTSMNGPIRNNTGFIKNIYPTVTKDLVNYQVGDQYSIKRMSVQVTSLSGAVVSKKETGYQNGNINLGNLSAGAYILTITSNDRKYQTTKKIIKN
jgi:hypothetical protein